MTLDGVRCCSCLRALSGTVLHGDVWRRCCRLTSAHRRCALLFFLGLLRSDADARFQRHVVSVYCYCMWRGCAVPHSFRKRPISPVRVPSPHARVCFVVKDIVGHSRRKYTPPLIIRPSSHYLANGRTQIRLTLRYWYCCCCWNIRMRRSNEMFRRQAWFDTQRYGVVIQKLRLLLT